MRCKLKPFHNHNVCNLTSTTKIMGISIEDFLYEYCGIDELKEALDEIGIPAGRTKDERVQKILDNWAARRRKWVDLLNYPGWDDLAKLCDDFKITYYDDDDEDELIKKIKKYKILIPPKNKREIENFPKIKSNQKQSTQVPDVHFHIGSINISKGGKIGITIIIAVAALVIGMLWTYYVQTDVPAG